jgi:hypothetical protein
LQQQKQSLQARVGLGLPGPMPASAATSRPVEVAYFEGSSR